MLLIGLVLAIAVVCFVLYVKFSDIEDLFFGLGSIAGIAFLIMAILVVVNNLSADSDVASFEQLYNSLVYQMEHDLYTNDNDIGKKELYDEITKWNRDIAVGKAMQHNIWVGIFWANIYDQFDLIELKE